MEKTLEVVGNVVKPIVSPILTKLGRPLQMLTQLPRKAFVLIRRPIQAALSKEESNLGDYFSFGRYYIAKRLIAYLLVAGLVLVYFLWINPPAFLLKWYPSTAVLHTSDPDVRGFTGAAELYDEQDHLIYSGGLENGLFSGTGSLYGKTGLLLYAGEFQQGQKSGLGLAYDPQGRLLYKGSFANDTYSGKGALLDPATGKIFYEGEFQNGIRSGQGKDYFENGKIKYDGAFQNDVYTGDGKQFFQSGTLHYEGGFINGRFSGNGTEFRENGQLLYKGTFERNQYQGQGTLFSETGQAAYAGEFRNGLYHGDGELFYPDGSTEYKGAFQNGQFHGFGTLFDQDGNILAKSEFQHGAAAFAAFIGKSAAKIEALMGKPAEILPLASAPSEPDASGLATGSSDPADLEQPAASPYQLYQYPLEGLLFVVKTPAQPDEYAVVERVVLTSPATVKVLTDSLERSNPDEQPGLANQLRSGKETVFYPLDDYLYTFIVDARQKTATRVMIKQLETVKK